MYREHVRWYSPSLGRDMEYLWFGKFGRPVMLFPTSAGRYYENEDFKLAASLSDKDMADVAAFYAQSGLTTKVK